jgi:hypothetical protein
LREEALEYAASDNACRRAETYVEFKAAVEGRYKKKNTVRFYREQLASMKKNEKETVEEFADRIKVINARTYILGENEERNAVLLEETDQRALDAFVLGLRGTLGEKVRPAQPKGFSEAVAAAVAVVEVNRRVAGEATARTIFAVENKGCYNCGRQGHIAAVCRSLPRCYTCGKIGHTARICRASGQQMETAVGSRSGQHMEAADGSRGGFSGTHQFTRGNFRGRNFGSQSWRGRPQQSHYGTGQQGGGNNPDVGGGGPAAGPSSQ